jgi:D-sedoheptulose 7-phosphate isomerase
VAELTARVNDDGWAQAFTGWLEVSRVSKNDAVLVLSVGGGDEARQVSPNLIEAVKSARKSGARVLGIVSRDGGYTAKNADACVLIPVADPERVTPHAEAFQSVVWHLLVSHPDLRRHPTKWESIQKK